jgi:hypothetical protein
MWWGLTVFHLLTCQWDSKMVQAMFIVFGIILMLLGLIILFGGFFFIFLIFLSMFDTPTNASNGDFKDIIKDFPPAITLKRQIIGIMIFLLGFFMVIQSVLFS